MYICSVPLPCRLSRVLALGSALQLWFVPVAASLCHFAPVKCPQFTRFLYRASHARAARPVALEELCTDECSIWILGHRRGSKLSLSHFRGLRPLRSLFFSATSKPGIGEPACTVCHPRSGVIFCCIRSGDVPPSSTGAFSAQWNFFLLFTPLEKEISCLVQTKKGRAHRQPFGLRAYTCGPAFL